MKIALFTDTFVPQVNGVSNTLKRLADYLNREKIDYQIYAPNYTKEDYYSEHIRRFMSFPFFLYPECRITFPNKLKLFKQLEAFKPDLLHIATPFNLGLTGLRYGKKQQIPMVASYHTHFDHYLKYYRMEFLSPWVWRYFKWFYQDNFQKIFVPSQETKSHLYTQGFTNIHFWKRGVDCDLFHPDYETTDFRKRYGIKAPFVFLFVSRLAQEKNLETFIQIIHNLPKSLRHSSHWLIVGDGPMRSKLEKEISDTNVTFTGYLEGEDLAKAYAVADLFVFPSASETFGNVVLEAFASKIPVIGANRGGVSELIDDGKTGFLCDAYKADEYIEKIMMLVNHPVKRQIMGERGRQYALKQSWDSIFSHLIADYEEVIYDTKKQKEFA